MNSKRNNHRNTKRRDDPGAIDGRAAVQDYGTLTGRELGAARRERHDMLIGFTNRATPAKALPKVRKTWAQRMAQRAAGFEVRA